VPHDPSFSILYGDLKAGKTADALAAFPAAIYVAAPGALSPATSVWGFAEPKIHDLESFKDIREFGEKLPQGSTTAIVCDDATLIADRTAIYYEKKGIMGWDLWRAVVSQAIKMRDSLRRRGFHVVLTCHAGAAYIEQGVRRKGGPSFQGQARMKIPAAADLLLRAEARSGAGFGWPYVYRTAPHPDWLQGSRYNTPDSAPMNLGEILRAAGFKIPRLRGLEWQEDFAAALAAKLLTTPGLGSAEYVKTTLSKAHDVALARFTKDEKHAMWAVRDGYDRAVLKIAQAGHRASLWGF
jgi:hypothetical protein